MTEKDRVVFHNIEFMIMTSIVLLRWFSYCHTIGIANIYIRSFDLLSRSERFYITCYIPVAKIIQPREYILILPALLMALTIMWKLILLPFLLVDSVFNGSQNRRYSMCVYRYIQTNIILHVYSIGHLIKVSWSQPKLTKLI